MAIKTNRHIVVELGNIGLRWPFEKKAAKTTRFAKKAPNVQAIGIDRRKLNRWFSFSRPRLPENVRQINADFLGGLKQLPDGAVSRIYSSMSLGHYDANGHEYFGGRIHFGSTLDYTAEVAASARKKLRVGGKLKIVVEKSHLPLMEKALEKAGFSGKEVVKVGLKPSMKRGTYWMKLYSPFPIGRVVYRIIATKKN
jgi:hypothetical protein